jgi:hypothetical protein
LSLCAGNAEQPCLVSDFKLIALSTNNQIEREKAALTWLKKIGPSCSLEKLIIIRNNRANWLGTADTTEVDVLVDTLLGRKK